MLKLTVRLKPRASAPGYWSSNQDPSMAFAILVAATESHFFFFLNEPVIASHRNCGFGGKKAPSLRHPGCLGLQQQASETHYL